MKIEPTAAIIPPIRQLILLGETLEKSNAGETKLATILIPMVAIIKVKLPKITTKVLSSLPTISTGSVMSLPYTGSVAAIHTTVSKEKPKKLIGSPRKLPILIALKLLP
ncbi:Uncharacterised protein [Acinetobacter baumannii]|nr:Uncharacterised protein [Acinetobacter baumannii]SSU20506.1 Uncharacterised protein [Acinetobacter baumannii]SSU43378.1 Uncharacterised protein [Acinetobacter baumannii]